MNNTKSAKTRSGYTIGIVIALLLAVMTVIEYFVALVWPSPVILLLIGLVKAALVIWFFMHVYRLWRPEGSH